MKAARPYLRIREYSELKGTTRIHESNFWLHKAPPKIKALCLRVLLFSLLFLQVPHAEEWGLQKEGGHSVTLVSSLWAASRLIFLWFVYLSAHFTSRAVVRARFGYGKEGQESKSTGIIFKVRSISLKVRLLEATGWCIARDYLSQAVPLKCTRFKSVANRGPEAHQQQCRLGPGKSKELPHPSICTPDRRDVRRPRWACLAVHPPVLCLPWVQGGSCTAPYTKWDYSRRAWRGLIRKWISEELLCHLLLLFPVLQWKCSRVSLLLHRGIYLCRTMTILTFPLISFR